MEAEVLHEDSLIKLVADEYAGKIMRATYGRALSVQQISKQCSIPIAVAYRRVGILEKAGLLRCVHQEEVFRGKKVKYYRCAVKMVKILFIDGQFVSEVAWLPNEELFGQNPIAEVAKN
ncbi:MAG: helix-turn-helix domain-containing protein [Methanomassiliicoccales archaeon]|jgi:predicted transcriptional regulator|nr:helix-turn-helix domain-containing protein [Methanomassiliicoccales archaeon]